MSWLHYTDVNGGAAESHSIKMHDEDAQEVLRWWENEPDSLLMHIGAVPDDDGDAGRDAGPALVREQIRDLYVTE